MSLSCRTEMQKAFLAGRLFYNPLPEGEGGREAVG